MAKNIIICLDGTGNEIEENISNVLKIYRCVRSIEDQPVYYTQGVGTLVDVGLWSVIRRILFDRIFGLVFGYGIDERVQNAYRFIVERYEEGDKLFIFGYSRGAYSARVLAGMIHSVGVLRPNQVNLIGAAYAAYLAKTKRKDLNASDEMLPEVDEDERPVSEAAIEDISHRAVTFRRITQSRDVTIHFLGLFDTVASVLVPGVWLGSWWPFRFNPYRHTYQNSSVRQVRHAVSIDERRQYFPASLWPDGQRFRRNRFVPDDRTDPQILDELWFAGAHGDVGGGNVRKDSGLSQIPLIWMMEAAQEAGLLVFERMLLHVTGQKNYSDTTDHSYPPPDPTAMLHPSFAGLKGKLWFLMELLPAFWRKVMDGPSHCIPRFPPLGRRRPIPSDANIHESVRERMEKVPGYRPGNLPEAKKGKHPGNYILDKPIMKRQ